MAATTKVAITAAEEEDDWNRLNHFLESCIITTYSLHDVVFINQNDRQDILSHEDWKGTTFMDSIHIKEMSLPNPFDFLSLRHKACFPLNQLAHWISTNSCIRDAFISITFCPRPRDEDYLFQLSHRINPLRFTLTMLHNRDFGSYCFQLYRCSSLVPPIPKKRLREDFHVPVLFPKVPEHHTFQLDGKWVTDIAKCFRCMRFSMRTKPLHQCQSCQVLYFHISCNKGDSERCSICTFPARKPPLVMDRYTDPAELKSEKAINNVLLSMICGMENITRIILTEASELHTVFCIVHNSAQQWDFRSHRCREVGDYCFDICNFNMVQCETMSRNLRDVRLANNITMDVAFNLYHRSIGDHLHRISKNPDWCQQVRMIYLDYCSTWFGNERTCPLYDIYWSMAVFQHNQQRQYLAITFSRRGISKENEPNYIGWIVKYASLFYKTVRLLHDRDYGRCMTFQVYQIQ